MSCPRSNMRSKYSALFAQDLQSFHRSVPQRSTAAEHFIIRMRRDDEGIHAVTPGWFFSMTLLLCGPQFRIRALHDNL